MITYEKNVQTIQMQLRERTEMQKTMFQSLYGKVYSIITNWTNHTVLNTLQQKRMSGAKSFIVELKMLN